MSAHQTRSERQEIPLAAGRLQHLQRVDAKTIENKRQLIDKRYVDIALGIFDDFGRFRDSDAARLVGSGPDNSAIELVNDLRDFRRGTRCDFPMVVSLCSLSPGLIRSGLYPTKKSRLNLSPEISSIRGTQTSSVAPG